MLKKIKLDIESYIENLTDSGVPDGEAEKNKSSYVGTMRIADGAITLSYKEADENGTVSCSIVADGKRATVRRNGSIVSTLVFEENEVFETVYSIPPYKFDMTVRTERLINTLSIFGGMLEIIYSMDVGGAKKNAKMKIEASEVTG